MKTLLIALALMVIVVASCKTSQKNTKSTTVTSNKPATPASSTSNTATVVASVAKPSNGIYAPGNDELAAIQAKYKDVTLEQLTAGHKLYTQGACINCHSAKNIYRYDEDQWSHIIDNMARAAKINDAQKDAVFKYVLAIKAANPNRN